MSRRTNSTQSLMDGKEEAYTGPDESPAPIRVKPMPGEEQGSTFEQTSEAMSTGTTGEGLTITHNAGTVSTENFAVWELSRKVFDNICFIFYCREHRKVLLNESGTGAGKGKTLKFFPYVQLPRAKKWNVAAIEGANSILSDIRPTLLRRIVKSDVSNSAKAKEAPFARFECIHIFRFQLPFSRSFITRLVYLALMKPTSNQNDRCCQDGAQCRWFALDDIIESKLTNVWGPEVGYFSNHLEKLVSNPPGPVGVTEYSMADARKYQTNADAQQSQVQILRNEEAMLAGAGVTNSDIERLYGDFIEHSFPSFFMIHDSFELFMAKRHEIETDVRKLRRYFHAFRTRGKPYMQFHELLLGLVSIDPRAMHGEVRVKMVFRYYDIDKDDYLNVREFSRLLRDICRDRSNPGTLDDQQVREEMQNIGAVMVNGQLMVPLMSFKRAVGSHAFRGTSRLCRASHSPFAIISQSLVNRKVAWGGLDRKSRNDVLRNRKYEGVCSSCRAGPSYDISDTIVYLDERSGRFIHAKSIPKLNGAQPSRKTSPRPQVSSRRRQSELSKKPPTRQYSLDITFNKTLVLHYLLDMIREFNKTKGNVRVYRGLMSTAKDDQKLDFFNDIKDICREMATMLESEERCLHINDACYVIGDLHGNLEDLLTLEEVLWRRAPIHEANLLFLGDYVDRGRWGFEVFVYLMCLKLLSPNRVFLLRGNHEVKHIQMKYTFQKEMTKKYGKDYGIKLFEWVNAVFDRLPVCAVINDSIFCCHGGLPYTELVLETLNTTTPKVVTDPETEAPSVWELIWSDPVENERFKEAADLLGMAENAYGGGFLPNKRRGTSVVFNGKALELFFKINGLRTMIRAHEVPASGFRFNFGTSCLTIFSCSHYCGADNESAVVLVDREGRMRIIRIDTTANSPCTENL